jgi:hypothetical protein
MLDIRWRIRVAALAATLLLAPGPAAAEEESTVSTGIAGVTAGVCSLAYTPLKIAYAGSGLAVSAVTFLLSAGNAEASARVARTAVRGDYVITPAQLRGQRRTHFFGE